MIILNIFLVFGICLLASKSARMRWSVNPKEGMAVCGCVWLCVAGWLCGCVAMWLRGYVAMWLCGYVVLVLTV